MASELSVKDGGTWRTIPALYVNNGSSWLPINSAWVKDGGTWQLFYGGNASSTSYTTPGTYSFTVPSGVFSILITACGGAGPGGSGDGGTTYNGPGGGGGGANLISDAYAVTPGQVLTVTVGAAGTPPTYASQTGSNGIPSTVTGTGVSFATGAGEAGRGYYAGAAGGAGANGANSGGVPTAGTSTNGGANGGSGGGYYQAGNPGQDGRVVISYQTTTYSSGSGTFTVPAGIFKITIQACGGGGGGGSADAGSTYQGDGGGGGGSNVVSSTIDVIPGQSFSYSVGAGGAPGPYSYTSGSPGGDSTISGVAGSVTSYGGGGGTSGSNDGTGFCGIGGSGANYTSSYRVNAGGTSTNGGVSGGRGGLGKGAGGVAGDNGFVRFIY